jgi:hypothetical protein
MISYKKKLRNDENFIILFYVKFIVKNNKNINYKMILKLLTKVSIVIAPIVHYSINII